MSKREIAGMVLLCATLAAPFVAMCAVLPWVFTWMLLAVLCWMAAIQGAIWLMTGEFLDPLGAAYRPLMPPNPYEEREVKRGTHG